MLSIVMIPETGWRKGVCSNVKMSAQTSAQMSCVRIHVERCIGRMKTFKILSVTIVAGLCNLMPPLIACK